MTEDLYVWLKIGWILFGIAVFAAITVLAYHPRFRERMARHATMPLDDDRTFMEGRNGQN